MTLIAVECSSPPLPSLGTQGHAYRDGDGTGLLAPSWAQRVYLPTRSDSMVAAFRRWIDEYTAGKGAPWSLYLRSSGEIDISDPIRPPRRETKERVLDRYDSHVTHCSACNGALANARRVRRVAEGSVAAMLLVGGIVTRVRGAALVFAALSFAVARACAAVDEAMRLGPYPPPRNVS